MSGIRRALAPSSLLALAAGVFAALGSVSAKLAVAQNMALGLPLPLPASPWLAGLLARALMLAGIGASNFFMWLFFTKALRLGHSTPRVMMLQTVANFATTAVCGVYIFGDALSARWWTGASLIATGLALLSSHQGPPEQERQLAKEATK